MFRRLYLAVSAGLLLTLVLGPTSGSAFSSDYDTLLLHSGTFTPVSQPFTLSDPFVVTATDAARKLLGAPNAYFTETSTINGVLPYYRIGACRQSADLAVAVYATANLDGSVTVSPLRVEHCDVIMPNTQRRPR